MLGRILMKEKVLNKLIKVSKKSKLLRYPILAIIFVFLAVCHFGSFLRRQRFRFCGVMCVCVLFLLSSSFALPILLDMDVEAHEAVVYQSDLEELLQNDGGSEIVLDDGTVGGSLGEYESYDVRSGDAYSLDEILLEYEEYLASQESDEQTPEEDEGQSVEFSADDWRLFLVNKNYPIPEDYSFTLTTITGTMQCDERIFADLLLMLRAAQNDRINLIICSAYRPYDRQVTIFDRHVRAYMNKGLNYVDAYKLSSQVVAIPGTSEHQIGLALDIYTASHLSLDHEFGETEAGKWLNAHCAEYGFILRYPKGKEAITSIVYEPWHFRYVGREAARIIMSEGITLEEFLEKYVR